MLPSLAQTVLRVLLNCGHGLSNLTPGVYDPGAVSCYGQEHEIVSQVVDKVSDLYFFARDDRVSPATVVTILETPRCSLRCLKRYHQSSSHLGYVVRWINEVNKKFDYVISLHMNSSPSEESSGVEVYYSKVATAHRLTEARAVAQAVATVIGIPNRGIYRSNESQHSSLAILDETRPPALLIELGFVTNKMDVAMVELCGAKAVEAAIEAIRTNSAVRRLVTPHAGRKGRQ